MKKSEKESVSAVVPAYNEAKRIAHVLKILDQTDLIKEIIVVNDGSADNTGSVVKGLNLKKVKYFRNNDNRGKSYSMDRGVKMAKSDIIFFCDADLKGLKPAIVTEMIEPILRNEVDMYIGVRNNVFQKTIMAFGLNSGERAMRKELWQKLPKYYKHRYRIETGLNLFVKYFGRGYKYKVFPYYQTLKEKKYGFFKGTFIRWWMNLDVAMAFLRFFLFDYFRFKTKKY